MDNIVKVASDEDFAKYPYKIVCGKEDISAYTTTGWRMLAMLPYAEVVDYPTVIPEVQEGTMAARLADTATLFGSLQSIAENGGKGMAKAAATFGAVEATVNAYRAATAAQIADAQRDAPPAADRARLIACRIHHEA